MGNQISHSEFSLNSIQEKLQDILSLVILLENDSQQQNLDEVYQRIIHLIHEILKSAVADIKSANAEK